MKTIYFFIGVVIVCIFGFIALFSRFAPETLPVENQGVTFREMGNLVRDNPGQEANTWYLVYEKPGSPGLSVPLRFSSASTCTTGASTSTCNPVTLYQGARAEVKGNQLADGVHVQGVTFAQVPVEDGLPIKLYYYNPAIDQGPGGVQCSSQGLVAVERVIPRTTTPVQDVIRLLLRGEITEEERRTGVTSEFPLSGVALQSASLGNGILTLTFQDPQNKTGGGSCRVGILWKQIEATAKQFSAVKTVRFMPEELFQP